MQENNTGDINLKRYWALVVKRRYIALAVGLAVVSAFTWGAIFWPKTYEASSTVFVERGFKMGNLTKEAPATETMDERLRVLKNALTSRNIVDRVARKLGLDKKVKGDAQYEGMIDGIIKDLDVKTSASSDRWNPDLFEISYRGSEPRTVRDLVNTLVAEYIEENAGYKRNAASGAYEFIKGQLADYKAKLDESDRAVRDFQERNPGVEAGKDVTLAMKADMLDTARAEADVKLKESQKRRDGLRKELAAEKENVAIKDGPQARLEALNKQLMVLTAKYTDDYPDVKKVRGEIEEVNKQIAEGGARGSQHRSEAAAALDPSYSQLRQQLSTAESDVEVYRVKVEELARQQRQARGMLYLAPKVQETWAKLQRDRTAYQKIYDDLVQQLGSAGVSKDLENSNKGGSFRVVDAAVLPYYPVKPNTALLIVLGMFLGLAAGTGAAVWLDQLSHSIKDEGAIESQFNLPVFATIQTVTTEEDRAVARRLDLKVFAAAGAYFLFIVLALMNEFLFKYFSVHTLKN